MSQRIFENVEEIKVLSKVGTKYKRFSCTTAREKGRIFWLESPFRLKDEIKMMAGSRWHGFDNDEPMKIWSVADCPRNHFQLAYLKGENPYAWFDRPVVEDPRVGKRLLTLPGMEPVEADLFDHQKDMVNRALTYHFQLWCCIMAAGKAQLSSAKIYTPEGFTTFGAVQPGDTIINPDGGHCKVKGVYPQGVVDSYRVTFNDGSHTDVGGEHLWAVNSPNRKYNNLPDQVLSTTEILGRGLEYANGNKKWFIPMTKPVEFSTKEQPVDAYVMGYLLGNGSLTHNQVSIGNCIQGVDNIDTEVVDTFNSRGCSLKPLKGRQLYSIQTQVVKDYIKLNNLNNTSEHKHIPEAYLYGDLNQRRELLRGLLDADGTPQNNTGVEFGSTSKALAKGVQFLVESLGGKASIAEKVPTFTHKGEKREGKLFHRMHLSFQKGEQPFKLWRKAYLYSEPKDHFATRSIQSIEPINSQEMVCISVDSESNCYVTDRFVVTHNTLAAIDVIEKSNAVNVIWCGPKQTLPQMEIEFEKWNLDKQINVQLMTYDALALMVDDGIADDQTPTVFIGDEASLCKNPGTRRANAAQKLADQMRRVHGQECYVILMSGTPAAKSPCDIWNLAEIVYPGYLAEGSIKALEARLGVFEDASIPGEFGHKYKKRVGWLCDEKLCATCCQTKAEGAHAADPNDPDVDYHRFKKSVNQVAKLHRRLDGLAVFVNESDMELPEQEFIVERLVPSKKLLRVARAVVESQPTVVKGLNALRQLSDGFSYVQKQSGTKTCAVCAGVGTVLQWVDKDNDELKYDDPSLLDADRVARLIKRDRECPVCDGEKEVPNMVRETFEVPCEKEDVLNKWLDIAEEESQGRICIFAGFQGSVDRCVKVAKAAGWDVFKLDGRGAHVETADGKVKGVVPLAYWANMENKKVAFIANSASGGFGLTLIESSICLYYSNSHRSEMRTQSQARIRRPGQLKTCRVVDIVNLPSDQRVLDLVMADRKLEKMTLGDIIGDSLE